MSLCFDTPSQHGAINAAPQAVNRRAGKFYSSRKHAGNSTASQKAV